MGHLFRPKNNPYIQKKKQKLKPYTGGIKTEEELRAYARCSRFFEFGGKVELPPRVRIFKHLIEYIIANTMRVGVDDPFKVLNRAISTVIARERKLDNLLEPELDKLAHVAAVWSYDFFSTFSFSKYRPISATRNAFAKVSNTSFDLQISGAFRSIDNESVHIIDFSPYGSEHAIINDPVTHLKLQLFGGLVTQYHNNKRPASVYHGFHISEADVFTYARLDSNQIDDGYMDRLIMEVKLMEKKHAYPVVPCLYSCVFKDRCKPGSK